MTKEQIKEILIRTFICFNYSLLLLPWASEIFAPSLGDIWMLKLALGWFFIALISQLLSITLHKNSSLYKTDAEAKAEQHLAIILIIVGILGSLLASYILIPNFLQHPVLDFALTIITLILWVIFIYISGFPTHKSLINMKLLSYGLVLLSVYSLSFRSSRSFIIALICFTTYIFLSAFLFVFTSRKNVKMVGVGISSVVILGFIIGGVKGWIGMVLGWVYRNIILGFLLFLVKLASYLIPILSLSPEAIKRRTENARKMIVPEGTNVNSINSNGSGLFSSIAELVKSVLPLIIFLIICYVVSSIIYKLIKRFYSKEGDKENDESKEFVRPDIRITDFGTRTGKLAKKIQRAIYGPSFEERIKKMLYEILLKMKINFFPLKPSSTPNEAKDIITKEEEALFTEYNRIRYGEKTLTKEEFINAEESYKRIKTLISYNYITNKVV